MSAVSTTLRADVRAVDALHGVVGVRAPRAAGASLLPEPAGDAARMPAGDLEQLLALQAQMATLSRSTGRTQVEGASKMRQEARKLELDARGEAAEGARSKSFWSKIGDNFGKIAAIAGVVASVALAVVTLGAGSPLAALAVVGAVASCAGFAQSEFHVLERFGVDPKVAGWVGFGCTLAGAAASLGVGLAGQAGTATSAVIHVAKNGGKVASIVGGAAAAGAGTAQIVAAVKQREIDGLDQEAMRAAHQAARFQLMVTQLIDGLREEQDDDTKAKTGIAGAIEARDAGLMATIRVRA